MSAPPKSRPGLAARIAALPVRGYRRFLSPLKPPTCRFHPTCSAYAQEALELHGVLRGSRLALWRLLRCQPFCKGGFDPVPGSDLDRARFACDPPRDVDTPVADSPAVAAREPPPPR